MFFFSLGTIPLMFGFGSMVSILGKRFTYAVMNIGAVLVTVLGFAMFAQGSNLLGMFSSEMFLCQYANHEQTMMDTGIEIVDGVQIVDSTLFPGEYPTITVQKGISVKWTIHAPEESINGCNYKMIIQEYGIEYTFENGENIIEFLPANAGTFSYTCWMGMIEGSIVVAENASNEFGSSETTDETLGNGYDTPDKVQPFMQGNTYQETAIRGLLRKKIKQ